MQEIKVEVKDNTLVIVMPLGVPQPSASGKTMVIASTRGNIQTEAKFNGLPITVGVNAYIRK